MRNFRDSGRKGFPDTVSLLWPFNHLEQNHRMMFVWCDPGGANRSHKWPSLSFTCQTSCPSLSWVSSPRPWTVHKSFFKYNNSHYIYVLWILNPKEQSFWGWSVNLIYTDWLVGCCWIFLELFCVCNKRCIRVSCNWATAPEFRDGRKAFKSWKMYIYIFIDCI